MSQSLKYILILAFAISPMLAMAADEVPADTTKTEHRNIFQRVLHYFEDSNKEDENKKFDITVLAGPYYSSETKFSIGIVASGLYRSDPLAPPSNVSAYANISTSGFYQIGIRGMHIVPKYQHRLFYDVNFSSFPTKFWGIGYESCNDNANETKMNRMKGEVQASFQMHIVGNLYIGPVASFAYIKAEDLRNRALLDGMSTRTLSYGVGATLAYDSRDIITNPHRGVYLCVTQLFRPRFIGNDYCFSTTDIEASTYRQVWKGGILAGNIHTVNNIGNPPWGLMAEIGSSYSMRGYYEGRYRDKNKIEGQIELRQHIYGRSGIAVWVGAGAIYDRLSDLRWNRILPNAGIGYRWEFKKDVNLRLDFGFGKNSFGVIFNINEAF